MNQFPHVFSPITIRGKTYKNRLIAAPTMFAHSIFTIPRCGRTSTHGGEPGQGRLCRRVHRGASGERRGGHRPVLRAHRRLHQPEGPDFEAIKEYADRIKKHGALCYFEFCHEGARAEYNPPYSPGAPTPMSGRTGWR